MHGRCDMSVLHLLLADAGRTGVLRWVARPVVQGGRPHDGFVVKLVLAGAIAGVACGVRQFGRERL
jgi:hypothetical protein